MRLPTLVMNFLGFLMVICPLSSSSSLVYSIDKGSCEKVGAPVAFDDLYGTTQGIPLTVPDAGNPYLGLLNNDYDPDGDPIFVVPTTLTSTVDPDNSITLNIDGSFIYTPSATFSGTDTFQYQVCDNSNPITCATSVIYIVVNNIPCIDVQIALLLEGLTMETQA